MREIKLERFSQKLFTDLGSPVEYTQDLIFQSTVPNMFKAWLSLNSAPLTVLSI